MGDTDPTKTTTTTNGTDPVKTDAGFDPTKVSDTDFAKVFDDPRTFNHPRFKELNERAKKAKEYEDAETQRQKDKLAEEKKWQELADLNKKEADKWKETANKTAIDAAIMTKALQKGAVDPEAVKALINRGSIKYDDQGNLTGVDEAIDELVKGKAYLFGDGKTPRVGNPTNPSDTNGVKRFKRSQLRDAHFYRTNMKDIQASLAAGMVEDDISSGRI